MMVEKMVTMSRRNITLLLVLVLMTVNVGTNIWLSFHLIVVDLPYQAFADLPKHVASKKDNATDASTASDTKSPNPEASLADPEVMTEKLISDGSKMEEAQDCVLRDLSNYTEWKEPLDTGSTKSKWAHCLRFQCMNNQSLCDNFAPTNFDGSDPPCCVHILRDMAREFDRAMCHLGLEYFPAFGMLLGLTRADKLIPWTIDNDYIITKQTLTAMKDLWDSASHLNHGVGFHQDQTVYRLCATPSFANGKLLRWKANETESLYRDSVYPFADIFWAEERNETTVVDQRECYHDVSSLRPAVRRAVYNGTFYQNFPQHPDALLTEYFGPNWRVPDARKKSHGGTHCGRRRSAEAFRAARRSRLFNNRASRLVASKKDSVTG
jgi:hypothetical protein